MSSKKTANKIDQRRAQSGGILAGFRGLMIALVVVVCTGFLSVAEASGSELSEPASGAAEDEVICEDCHRIDAILVVGLLRTNREVIDGELLFEEGDLVTLEDVEESVQRLRNTGIFRSVDYELFDQHIGSYAEAGENAPVGNDAGRVLKLSVDERWTLAAFFQFGQGGDTFHIMVGAQDINLRGGYRHLRGSYTRLGDANSYSLLFRNPRFLGERQELSVRTSLNNRLYTFYDGQGQVDGGFLLVRRYAALGFDRQWTERVATAVGTSFSSDTFSYDMVNAQRRDAQEASMGLSGPIQTVRVSVDGRLGRLDRDEYRVAGTTLQTGVDQNFHFGDAQRRSRRFRGSLLHFQDLPWNSTLAARGEIGFSTVDQEYMKFSAGGLNTLRGTFDMRHRGAHRWLGNVELRVPSINNHLVVLQHVAFVDAVGVTEHASQVLDLTAATTGIGLRIISRDFHGLIFRVDYALPTLGSDGPGLSFGAGQFF